MNTDIDLVIACMLSVIIDVVVISLFNIQDSITGGVVGINSAIISIIVVNFIRGFYYGHSH